MNFILMIKSIKMDIHTKRKSIVTAISMKNKIFQHKKIRIVPKDRRNSIELWRWFKKVIILAQKIIIIAKSRLMTDNGKTKDRS